MLYNGARFNSCALLFSPSGRNSEFNKEPEIERKSSKFNVLLISKKSRFKIFEFIKFGFYLALFVFLR